MQWCEMNIIGYVFETIFYIGIIAVVILSIVKMYKGDE